MTQSLVDQNLIDLKTLLNSNTQNNFQQSLQKNYSNADLGGKNFNDIFSKANNNYATNDNKPNVATNTNANTKPNDRLKNDSAKNSYDYSAKDNRVSQNNTQRNNNNTNTDYKESNSNNQVTGNSKSTVETSNAKDTKETTTTADTATETTTVTAEDKTSTLDALANVNLDEIKPDEDILTLADLTEETLDLLTPVIEEDVATDVDTSINAYYQSAIDTLTADTEETVEDTVTTTATETLADIDKAFSQATTENTTQNVTADTTLDKTTTAKTTDEISNSSKQLENLKQDLKADASQTETDKIQKPTKVEKTDDMVEVDTTLKAEANDENEVLFQATDDVVEEVQKIDVTQTDKKINAKEVLEKAGLGEAEMDALNVTVTEVSNTSTDLGNGFGSSQGNAQEDLTKMALQGANKTEQANATDKNFAKVSETFVKNDEAKEISKNDILAQINNKMQAQNINGKNKITLMLSPESLGKVTIELTKGKNGMEAKLLTDNVQVKNLLEKSIDGLKSALGDQGVSVNNVSVKVSAASEGSSDFAFNRESFSGNEGQQQNFGGENAKDDNNSNSQFAKGEKVEFADEEMIASEDEMIIDSELGNVDVEA